MRFDIRKALVMTCGCLALIASLAPPAAAQPAGWQPGPGALLDNTYAGFVDLPANGAAVSANASFVIGGWFVDESAQGWAGADAGQVWLGAMDGGGRMLADLSIGQFRPDVATALNNPYWAASGFSAQLPGSSVPAGSQTLYVYLHTGGKGWWYRTVNVTGGAAAAAAGAPAGGTAAAGGAPQLTITAPVESENVRAAGSTQYTITGNATDPTYGPGAIDVVDVWIFGERNSSSGTDLGTATLNSDGSWSLAFTPTKFPSTHTNIYVYAHSRVTGQTTEVIRGFNIKG
jgi:hypothetical protein